MREGRDVLRRRRHIIGVAWVVGSLAVWLMPGTAQAESLYEAFDSAFAANPTLVAQRAAVRVGIQDKELAATGFKPDIKANADYGWQDRRGSAPGVPATTLVSHPRGYGVSVSQNLFNGLKTVNSVAREGTALEGLREDLRATEQTVLQDAATAYMDVLRDKAIVELRRNNTDVLAARAGQTQFMFKIGQVTRTDVDQIAADLARSKADLATAKAALEGSSAVYRSIIGHNPGKLSPAAVPTKLIPASLTAAISVSQIEHPAIRAALLAVRAAEINIDVEKAGYSPTLDLDASASHRWDPETYVAKTDLTDVLVAMRLNVPIYDRGVTIASVQRARELASQRTSQLDGQRVQVRAGLVQNWGLFAASKTVITSADAEIAAAGRAFYGVQLEATSGQRTTLDILIQQQSLLNALVDREIAQHDLVVAGYKLLASLGRLSLAGFGPAETRGKGAAPAVGLRPIAILPPNSLESTASLQLRPSLN